MNRFWDENVQKKRFKYGSGAAPERLRSAPKLRDPFLNYLTDIGNKNLYGWSNEYKK